MENEFDLAIQDPAPEPAPEPEVVPEVPEPVPATDVEPEPMEQALLSPPASFVKAEASLLWLLC